MVMEMKLESHTAAGANGSILPAERSAIEQIIPVGRVILPAPGHAETAAAHHEDPIRGHREQLGLTYPTGLLHPSEGFLDQGALPLANQIARVPGSPLVNGAASGPAEICFDYTHPNITLPQGRQPFIRQQFIT
jgi:hypothetical protein